MKGREIHDPDVLLVIARECDFMTVHALGEANQKAYRQLSAAARQLRCAILGLDTKYPCPVCKRPVSLNKDGTYRIHHGEFNTAAKRTLKCLGSDKPYHVGEPEKWKE